jgi:RNA polymerase sigma-70 factor, ECF subfamily
MEAEDSFRSLTEPYARELHLHCYRMLGSLHDAEDALQETLIRAWRNYERLEGGSSMRPWLYRIATNVCLTASARARATLLAPYPDELLDELPSGDAGPAARYDLRESVQLAFLAAVQHLPARQRAVLLLHDVLGWSAREVAELLDSTGAAVNSALQRARATIEQRRTELVSPPREVERSLVGRYVEAWDAVDIDGLVALLREDAVLTMPPAPMYFEGRRAIAEFLSTVPAGGALDQIRLVETRANRQPAVAAYMLDPEDGSYRAYGVMVLTLDEEAIAAITGFADASIFPFFGLPPELEATESSAAESSRPG